MQESGKRSIVFRRSESAPEVVDSELRLPCSKCVGCRVERSRQWAMRCMDEASLQPENSFITLTYDKVNLPEDGFLHKQDFSLFMKRLRKEVEPLRVRFFTRVNTVPGFRDLIITRCFLALGLVIGYFLK